MSIDVNSPLMQTVEDISNTNSSEWSAMIEYVLGNFANDILASLRWIYEHETTQQIHAQSISWQLLTRQWQVGYRSKRENQSFHFIFIYFYWTKSVCVRSYNHTKSIKQFSQLKYIAMDLKHGFRGAVEREFPLRQFMQCLTCLNLDSDGIPVSNRQL